jgi:sigma-B regulation protein RsbU (phosphoserine phosphatase)
LQDQLLATLREQLVAIISGTIFVFIGFASCLFGAVRRHSGARIFLWLGAWSALYGAGLLLGSSSMAAALPHWIQIGIPFLRTSITYLLLPVAALVWLELSVGIMKLFIQVVIAIGLIVAVAGIGFFLATGSAGKLILFNYVVAAAALLVLLIVVAVPGLSRKLLTLPNRAVVVVGTLVFAVEALYYNLSFVFHYQTWRITDPLGLAALLFSFGYVAVQIALTSERRLLSIENELSIAREMQASILPSDNPELKNLRVAALYRPMTDIAGDFYDFIPVDPNRTGFLVADVTGHGVPAALVSSMIKVAMQSVMPSAHDPQEVLRELNRILCAQLRTRLVSAAYLWLDTENRIALYSAAGHPPLVLWRAGQFERIESNGMLLGVFPDADYPLHRMPIRSGDRLLLYTDGVSEPENANRDSFGDHKLEQVVRDNQARPPAELLNQILSAIHNWQPPSTPQHDDITMVAIDVV